MKSDFFEAIEMLREWYLQDQQDVDWIGLKRISD